MNDVAYALESSNRCICSRRPVERTAGPDGRHKKRVEVPRGCAVGCVAVDAESHDMRARRQRERTARDSVPLEPVFGLRDIQRSRAIHAIEGDVELRSRARAGDGGAEDVIARSGRVDRVSEPLAGGGMADVVAVAATGLHGHIRLAINVTVNDRADRVTDARAAVVKVLGLDGASCRDGRAQICRGSGVGAPRGGTRQRWLHCLS